MPKKGENEKKKKNTGKATNAVNRNRTGNSAGAGRPAPALTPEQIRENKRNAYMGNLDRIMEKAKNPYKPYLDIYGASGKLPKGMKGEQDFNVMEITIPEGMDDLFVTAVNLGSMMDPSRLDRNMTSSSFAPGSETYVGFNQLFLVENIPNNDKRMGEFPQVMRMAKAEARRAINDMASGKDDTRVYQYLSNLVNYAITSLQKAPSNTSRDMLLDREYEGNKTMVRMVAEIISREPFKSHIEVPEYDRMKIMALANQAKAREQLYTEKAELMKNPPAAGSPEREAAVAEVMFKEYLIGTIAAAKNDNYVEQEGILQGILDKHGVDPTSREYYDLFRTPQNVVATRVAITENLDKNRTTDQEVLLSQPGGIEILRQLYMDSIKDSQTFKDLVAADGMDFQEKMMELDETAKGGLGSFSNVRTKGEAEPFNAMNLEAYNRESEVVSDRIGNMLNDQARRKYWVTAYDEKNLTGNHRQIELLSEEFEKNAKLLPGDNTIQTISKELDNLKNQARSMMKAQNASKENLTVYTGTIDRIQQNIDTFFREKGASPNQGVEPLYMNLRRLSRNLKWNKSGIMVPRRRNERERILKENEDNYEKPAPETIDALVRLRKEDFEEERRGALPGRQELVNKAETATERLADLLKSGQPLEDATKQEVIGYLRDILAERVHTKASPLLQNEVIHFSERYTTNIVEKLPEYKALTEKFTRNDIGRILFHGGGDQLLKGYSEQRLVEMLREERSLETKAVSDRLTEEEAEWGRQVERDKYRAQAAERKADHTNPIRLFHQYYGSKPDIHPSLRLHQEYNALRIEEIPEGLDENTVTAIVLGSIMRKDRMENPMTSSNFVGGESTYLSFNRNFIIDNFIKERPDAERQGNFPLALLEGRRDAIQAIEEYKNGHPEKAKEMIKTFVDFASEGVLQAKMPTTSNMISITESTVQKTMLQLGAEMVGKPPF